MLDLKAVEYPPQNILFYWNRNPGVDYYNLYVKPFGSLIWTRVNPTPVPPAKLNYPLMPVDVLPDGVVSIDPVYYNWWTLDQQNTSEWVVREVVGAIEGPDSNVYTHYPKAVIATVLDHQNPRIAQMQRWDPALQRFVNWDAKVDVVAAEEVYLLNVAHVKVNPATEDTSQAILSVLSSPGTNGFNQFGVISASSGAWFTVLSKTVLAGETLNVSGFVVWGDADAEWSLEKSSGQVGGMRTSPSNLTGVVQYGKVIPIVGPDVVTMKVRHWYSGKTGNFHANLEGRIV